jgi:hypothetical protein
MTGENPMTDPTILVQPSLLPESLLPPKKAKKQPNLQSDGQHPENLPAFVRQCPVAMRYLELLGPLAWGSLPERPPARNWRQPALAHRALVAAELLKLNEGLRSVGHLRRYLVEHPSLIWLFGFPVAPAPKMPFGFNPQASLPTQRHLTQLLRQLPNADLQGLLAESVQLICQTLHARAVACGECISLDTKHIVAWVKENNPKAYVADRFNKAKQPAGDPDCKLGCKRRRNQFTPSQKGIPARSVKVGEYYWGYASGVVVTKVPDLGEFALAELTQPFDQGDLTYFFPLMTQVEDRLGFRPRFATFDAAFDAWYVYAHFYRENDPTGGFAAVPFSDKGGYTATGRHFSADGLPICAAGLPMPLKFTFTDRTSCLVEHERGKYVCPLLFPKRTRRTCPIHHKQWPKGGCTAMMPVSIGARLRYTLDRDSDAYKNIYRQRTAVERINSQAVALGIERPHLRNGQAIANQNTLIYLLINLRFLQRLRVGQPQSD